MSYLPKENEMKFSTNTPTHGITVRGEIIDRQQPSKQRREIGIERAESHKLPLQDYPLTHLNTPDGLEVLASSSHGQCQASFHRYPELSRYGEGAYIGSATRRLKDRSQADRFSVFLQQAGVSTPGTEVSLDFVKHGRVIHVYVSAVPPAAGHSAPSLATH